MDKTSLEVADRIKTVALSNFVKQMLEESGIQVAGVVYHGLDMKNHRVSISISKTLKKKLRNQNVILAVAANDPRKGLAEMLNAYRLVEHEVRNSFLVLHSTPTGHYNLKALSKSLKIKRLWLTNLYGKLALSQLNALYNMSDIYVQPSYSEGFGLPILEAFS